MLQRNEVVQTDDWNGEPTLYEIKIKGEIDERRWRRWFEGMDLTLSETGDTTITGPVTDQAQLYGMLSRLRDMALPLVSVRALSALQPPFFLGHRERPPQRARWMLILLYLLLVGGMSSFTVYLAIEVLHVALSLMFLFFVLGGMSYAFAIADGGGWVWRGLTWLNWLGGAVSLVVYLGVAGTVHVAILIGGICFILAAGLLYLWGRQARREPVQQWEQLGEPGE